MTDATSIGAKDRLLSRRIAVLMRWGTLTASILLIGGALLAWGGVASTSSVVIIGGCAVLILLPLFRLLLMLTDFARRADKPYVGITALVIILILAAATTGMIL